MQETVTMICPQMVDLDRRVEMMEKVEALFDAHGGKNFADISGDLREWGFVQKGGDPATVVMEHGGLHLYLEVELDDTGKVHGYALLPFEEMARKQERFRW
ncbi:hypothetical protein [Methanoculleus sp. 7T]|uniref:hypothetical protein n=1 Tax=Methanoculleus sp. 7T TaxID=2937282 RepID=UPI0020BE6A0C|nr:hypothetical protein [Methanoculleus sp. 7T]MCK8519864.1 hypothetical protein [Methanoculleus sp. 7T]